MNNELQTTSNGIQTMEVVQDSALATLIQSEITAQVQTAKMYPRSIKMFLDKTLSIASVSEDIAASCTYAVPRSGKNIEGPSVRLAEIVCSSYGNIRAGARVIANDGKNVTAQGYCHDLETNNFVAVEVKRKITNKQGVTYNEDLQTLTGNAACAIAYRNAVYKVVPMALINDVYEKIKLVARGTVATLKVRRGAAVKYFTDQKITEKQICEVLDIKKIEDIDLDKLQTLSGMKSAIKNGETNLKDLFEKAEDNSLEDIETLFEFKQSVLTPEEFADAKRIIDNKEAKSYAKLKKMLSEK